MNKTKIRILRAARDLFNEQGYGNVTIRMIAGALKMSSGNLNYHFKKREDILEALYFEMVETFDQRITQLEEIEYTIQKVYDDMFSSLSRMIDYRFFWTDLYNILRSNSAIKTHFDAAHQARFKGYQYLYDRLIEKALMRDFEFDKEGEFLAERMINCSDTWLYSSFIYDKKIDTNYIREETNNLLFMLFPYLTNKGKQAYKKVLPEYIK